jgi:membrane protease YdiL (CAAX protease family)
MFKQLIKLMEMKSKKLISFFLILAIVVIVCMTLFSPIPAKTKLIIRILLIALFFTAWRIFIKKKLTQYNDLSFSLLVLNLAFLIATPFTPAFWNLKLDTSQGFALAKLSDSATISLVLIISFIVAGYRLRSIYLTKGRLVVGLITGILFFFLLGYLALNNPQQRPGHVFLQRNIIWILVFVFANGFMEELIFRGIFLEKLNSFFKPFWSILLTSVCFAAPHLTVNYQSNVILFSGIVFFLGMICGYAMCFTRSIIAPTLIHAGADLMIIIPVFASYGVTG